MENSQYTEEYFIQKFEGIDDDLWITGDFEFEGKCCVLGHCGVRYAGEGARYNMTPEAIGLIKLVKEKTDSIALGLFHAQFINDGMYEAIRLGETPKERVLKFLKSTPHELAIIVRKPWQSR